MSGDLFFIFGPYYCGPLGEYVPIFVCRVSSKNPSIV